MASVPMQLAKLQAPILHNPVLRHRVFDRLDALRTHRVIWIGGPAGAGKTTLVGSYFRQRHIYAPWLRIDAGDADPAGFFYYLTALADQFKPKDSAALPLLTPEYLLNFEGYVRRYFRALFQRLPPGCILVFDNCQDAASDTFHKILEVAAQQVPEDYNLVLISRLEPPAAWAHLQATQILGTIGWDTLKLDETECRAMAQQAGISLQSDLEDLVKRVDGWAAGLTLMCTNLRDRGGPTGRDVTRSREGVFHYFAGQIFSRIEPDEREFLKRLALFDHFSAHMARALTGVDDSQSKLERLYRQHYFTNKLEAMDAQYQLHPLFREFLLTQLELESHEELTRLQCQAAAISAAGGQVEAAARLLRSAEDWPGLTQIVLGHAEAMLAQGRWQTVQQWIQCIPADLRATIPWVTFWLGMSHLRLDQATAIGYLEESYGGFLRNTDAMGQAMSACAIINAYYFQLGRFAGVDPWLERIEAMQPQVANTLPSVGVELQVKTAVLTACMLRRPDRRLFSAVDRVLELLTLAQIGNDDKILAGSIVLQYCVLAADLPRCERLLKILNPIMNDKELPPLTYSFLLSAAGYVYYCFGNNDTARDYLDRASTIALNESMYPALALADHFSIHLRICESRPDVAANLLGRMGSLMLPDRPCMEAMYQLDVCATALCKGDYQTAYRAGRESVRMADESGLRFFQIAYRSLGAYACWTVSDDALAEQWIEEGLAMSRGTIYDGYESLMRYTRSVGALHRGDLPLARQEVAVALRIAAQSEGFPLLRCALDVIPHAVNFAIREGIESDFARHIARTLRLRPDEEPSENWPWPVKIFTLGRFSIEVDESPLRFGRKTPKKDLALIKLLAAAGERGMAESRLKDALWPDMEGDHAANALRQLIHRVRGMLRLQEVIDSEDGIVALKRRWVWVDAWELDKTCARIIAADSAVELPPRIPSRLFELCRGGFLQEDSENLFLVGARAKLRGKFIDAVLTLARRMERYADMDSCYDLCRNALDREPVSESLCQVFLEVCLKTGRRAEGLAAYEQFRDALMAHSQVQPAKATQSLWAALHSGEWVTTALAARA